MTTQRPPIERSLSAFGWRHARSRHTALLILTTLSFPLIYASLEIPKIIVNEAINGGPGPRDIFGQQVEQIPFLLLLSGSFLGLVILINGFKWLINVGIGMLAERLLRRLRYVMFETLLRTPPKRLGAMRPRESVHAIMGEAEQLGGFMGELYVTPAFQGGQLLVLVTFIFVQDVWLGLAAIALYPIQAVIVPVLQKKVIALNRERARTARALADRLGEGIVTIPEMRLNGTTGWHLAQVSGLLHTVTAIRRAIYERKFTIKWINNVLTQLTPFLFFSIGGTLVIQGDLDFGALVAVLAAYKDLTPPWKALLTYGQRWIDFSSRFRLLIDGLSQDDLMPKPLEVAATGEARAAPGPLVLERLRVEVDRTRLEIAHLEIAPGSTIAILGGPPGAAAALMRATVGLEAPAEGTVRLAGEDLATAETAMIAREVAFAGPTPTLVAGTLRDNATYTLMRRRPSDDPDSANAPARLSEAALTGNAPDDPNGDWIDYIAAGVADTAALDRRLLSLIGAVGLDDTLWSVALNRRVGPDGAARLAPAITALRESVAGAAETHREIIEPWVETRVNSNASLLSNLLYAIPREGQGDARDPARALDIPGIAALLEESGGRTVLEDAGRQIARALVDLAEALGPTSPVLDRLGAFTRQDIAEAAALADLGPRPRKTERQRLAALAAGFVQTRDQLDIVDDAMVERILAARARAMPAMRRSPDLVAVDAEEIAPARTIANTLLAAPRRHDRRPAWSKLDTALREAVEGAGLDGHVLAVALQTAIGEAGLDQMSQRRLGLVRALLTRPRLIGVEGLADGATSADRRIRAAIAADLPEGIVVMAVQSEAAADGADVVIAIDESGAITLRDGSQPGGAEGAPGALRGPSRSDAAEDEA
ncbi:MAG: ABC transporter transmembrane domain-containing protein [Pseudomonadota bacterium]